MSKPARETIVGPTTLVPIGGVFVCIASLFGLARYVATIEVRTDTHAQRIAELHEVQRSTATDISDRLDAQGRDLVDLKQLEAATAAKVGMLVEHFGLEPRKRRR